MNIVTSTEFSAAQRDFLAKHDCRMEQDGDCDNYRKTWMCNDGSFMIEINRVTFEKIVTEIKGKQVTVYVKMMETECFSTEFGSMYVYEQIR